MQRAAGRGASRTVAVCGRRRLSEKAFEVVLTRPGSFRFLAGQRIRLSRRGTEREYTPVSAPSEERLRLCVRRVPGGAFSTLLCDAPAGTELEMSGPSGYFLYRPSGRPALFVATGTGIAPFVSMAADGAAGFTLLHGVASAEELYYRNRLRTAAAGYVPCLSRPPSDPPAGAFSGRVTDYLRTRLPDGVYDIYLCGRGEMITEVLTIVDDRFPDSRVFSERFFG